ncbi:MAG: hypothetical protein AAFW70_25725, partial [Cyanobacteria bacterium J06635_10]
MVAYVVALNNHTLDVKQLRYFLKQQLPEYLVPSAFVVLEALPLTENGKVNHQAMPALSVQDTTHDIIKPRTTIEEIITGIFAKVLKLEHPSIFMTTSLRWVVILYSLLKLFLVYSKPFKLRFPCVLYL